MNLVIETLIKKDSRGFESNNNSVFNQVRGASYSETFETATLKIEENAVKYEDKENFILNINNIVQDVTKITSILAFCHLQINSPEDTAIPVKFSYTLGGVNFKSSQFSVINCEGSDLSGFQISNLEIPETKTALLTLAITVK